MMLCNGALTCNLHETDKNSFGNEKQHTGNELNRSFTTCPGDGAAPTASSLFSSLTPMASLFPGVLFANLPPVAPTSSGSGIAPQDRPTGFRFGFDAIPALPPTAPYFNFGRVSPLAQTGAGSGNAPLDTGGFLFSSLKPSSLQKRHGSLLLFDTKGFHFRRLNS
jgi:hypothetical protein